MQVISALQKAVPRCTAKLGNDFAIVVDREVIISLFKSTTQIAFSRLSRHTQLDASRSIFCMNINSYMVLTGLGANISLLQ